MKLFLLPRNENIESFYKEKNNYSTDVGVDLYCPEQVIVPPNKQATINFQIQCAATQGETPCGYILTPRSSISKTPLRMSNSIGIIDPGYRGDIMAKVDNISDTVYTIDKGTRLFQIVDPWMMNVHVCITDSLDETDRGSGGFGSTGH